MNKYNLTKDILNELSLRLSNSSITNNSYNTKDEKLYINKGYHLLVVFTGTDYGLEEVLREIAKGKRYGFTFDIAISENGEDIVNIERIRSELQPKGVYTEKNKLIFGDIIERADAIVVPMSTQDTTAKLALGIQDNFVSTLLWQSLWHGKKVLMDFYNTITYRGTKSKVPQLQKIVDDYVKKLQSMGVIKIDRSSYVVDILNSLKGDANPINKPNNFNHEGNLQEGFTDEKKVITESDILSISPQRKEITVPMRAIITPLAYDTAKKLGIKIVKKS